MTDHQIKVLVIEDDEYSRDALAHLLAAEGYDAQSAHDGEAGLDKARETNPEVIVLDLNLPGIDGQQVIKKIRGDQSLASIPILVVTGDDDKTAQAAVDIGADGYLTKPVEFDTLISAITHIQTSPASDR